MVQIYCTNAELRSIAPRRTRDGNEQDQSAELKAGNYFSLWLLTCRILERGGIEDEKVS